MLLAVTAHRGVPRRVRALLCLAFTSMLAVALVGCAQAPATTNVATDTPTVSEQRVAQTQVVGPLLGTVEVWLDESGVMVWQPRVEAAGAYRFEVTNHGRRSHDLTIIRWDRPLAQLPSRSGRVLLQGLDIVAQSTILTPEESSGVDANLAPSGSYVLLSSTGTDFGDGMATTLRVGAGSAMPAPQPTPEADDDENVRVYLLDSALFLSREDVEAGLVGLHVQNLGPSPHDLVVVQWRGDPHALPVDAEGDVMLDSLTVVGRLDALAAGEEATLDVELDGDYLYVAFSSLPGDYEAGMAGQVMPR